MATLQRSAPSPSSSPSPAGESSRAACLWPPSRSRTKLPPACNSATGCSDGKGCRRPMSSLVTGPAGRLAQMQHEQPVIPATVSGDDGHWRPVGYCRRDDLRVYAH